MLRAGATTQTILKEFSSRFTGSLRDWFESLGPYRKLQVIQAQISEVLGVIYEQFLGEATTANEHTRREFYLMKCCSFHIKDLDFHYKRMSTMYYKLNGFNDPSLKHVFLASVPKEIQSELHRQFTIHQLDIANLSLGKIYQLAVNCLDRLCEHKEFFKDLIENNNLLKVLVKSLTFPLSAKVRRIALAQPKRDHTSENSEIQKRKAKHLPDPKNLTDFLKKRTLTSPLNSKVAVVLFVKRKVIL